MNERPEFDEIYMNLAKDIARRSTCQRTNSKGELMQVGAVLTDLEGRHVLAVGYNGNAAGLPNCCDSTEPGACGCVHAEANAAVKGPPDVPKILYCTHLPCAACAKLLINLGGVRKVWYLNDYRIKTAIGLFQVAGIQYEMYCKPFPACTRCGGQH